MVKAFHLHICGKEVDFPSHLMGRFESFQSICTRNLIKISNLFLLSIPSSGTPDACIRTSSLVLS
jgi:hypothetical protein